MSARKYSTIQPFSNLNSSTAQKDSGATKVSWNNTACLRPVLCSQVLRDVSLSTQHHSTRMTPGEIGKFHKTPSGNAWVQLEAEEQLENWERAVQYNEQMEQLQEEKASKLMEFQKDVKARVKKMVEAKQQALLAKTYKDIELERKVAHKTAFLAQAFIPNASEVMVHGRSNLMAKDYPADHPGQPVKYTGANLDEVEKLRHSIDHERKVKKSAREKLSSRQLAHESRADLPGGFWKETSLVECLPSTQSNKDVLLLENPDDNEELSLSDDSLNSEDLKPVAEKEVKESQAARRAPSFLFDLSQEEEIRKQEVKQRALLRRLYMDIEREQVKEYKKMKLHLNSILQIKKKKEQERIRQEEAVESEMSRGPNFTPNLSSVDNQRPQPEQQIKKQRESRRYIKALRSMLKEKIERLKIDVPPLCSCGNDIWATHPDLCANNCIFYKNPKGKHAASIKFK